MKTIIAGGRNYWLTLEDMEQIDFIHKHWPITEVVCGMAPGADCGGYFWSWWRLKKSPAKFPADWDRYGKPAGPIRNQKMAEYAEQLILFPGGRGSADMLTRAINHKFLIHQICPHA